MAQSEATAAVFFGMLLSDTFQEQHSLLWKVYRLQAGSLSFVWCYLWYGCVWQCRIMMLSSRAGHTATTDRGWQ